MFRADRFGWFGEPGSIEDYLKERGEHVRRGNGNDFELTVDDLLGWSKAKDMLMAKTTTKNPDGGDG